jgi:hypothetical protein
MKKITFTSVLCGAGLLALANCASVGPNTGTFTFRKTGTSGNQIMGDKKGEACAMSILGLIATGDASVEAASRAGGITKASVIDYDDIAILGVFARRCVIVKGS